MKNLLSDIFELLALIVIVPLVLLYRLISLMFIVALLASPMILLGVIVWLIVR